MPNNNSRTRMLDCVETSAVSSGRMLSEGLNRYSYISKQINNVFSIFTLPLLVSHTISENFPLRKKSAYFNEKNETDTADRNLRPVYEHGIKLCGKKKQ